MRGWLGTLRGRLITGVLLLLALIAMWPLRVAFSLLGLGEMGVAARSLHGTVWWGAAEELQVSGVRLGTVDVFLDPIQLLVGRARIDIRRKLDQPDDLSGAISIGIGTRSIDDVNGLIPLAAALAPLPISSVEFYDVSIRFAGNLCSHAEGRVRARVPALISGLNLANGLAGEARCAGNAVEFPLISQSGQERMDIRISSDGTYQATMRVRTNEPLLGAALGANGFRAVGNEQVLRINGRF